MNLIKAFNIGLLYQSAINANHNDLYFLIYKHIFSCKLTLFLALMITK